MLYLVLSSNIVLRKLVTFYAVMWTRVAEVTLVLNMPEKVLDWGHTIFQGWAVRVIFPRVLPWAVLLIPYRDVCVYRDRC